ncbi:hypothetical protein [Mesorhizobium sp. B1-1-7]|uniref:hypothetical protein n=1 Tax=Mesorhizobium sp. B1-1-7 TaxID=2589977 RepID=UPI00112ECA19|nr:hypothetical protein [Mesorhizobium sp. B1-1-7]TPN43239.1 hypothetical protein FJ978_31555 [Mesorhizobium sp. B1-1-7]
MSRLVIAPDLEPFLYNGGAADFFEWADHSANKIAEATNPRERAAAELMRVFCVAAVETGNRLKDDGIDERDIFLMMARVANIAVASALMSCLKDETPTHLLAELLASQAREAVDIMAPGKTLASNKDVR